MSDHEVIEGLYYSKEHEWVKIDGNIATVGITDYAQDLLTDIVFVELPQVGKKVKQFDPTCVVESVKSVSDVYAPLSGAISEVNHDLENLPELVNSDPFGGGWMFQLTDFNPDETDALMDAKEYEEFVAHQDH